MSLHRKKKIESIREYLFVIFSFSSDFNGIIYTSNKKYVDMNFYDRENDKWYDNKLKENFIQISKKNILNLWIYIFKHILKL